MKKIKNTDFSPVLDVYSGVKDYSGDNCLVLVDNDLKIIRVVSKRKDYTKERRRLDKMGLQHVIINKYGNVIDFTKNTVEKLEKAFPGYRHKEWSIWEKPDA